MARIAVIGPGAIGGAIAAWLCQNPAHDLAVCARTPFEDLVVTGPSGTLTARPEIWLSPEAARPVDWVLIATKAYDVEGAAAWLPALLGPQTRAAVLQNGVEHVARFSPYLDAARIAPVVVDLPVERTAPGRMRQARNPKLTVPEGMNGADFCALFSDTPDVNAATTPDFTSAAWRKLVLNCAGAVNALIRQPAPIANREPVAEVLRALMGECLAVARAEGAVLEDEIVETLIGHFRATPWTQKNSILMDRLAGRPLEIDARNGVIVRLGRKHGIPTPVSEIVIALLEAAA